MLMVEHRSRLRYGSHRGQGRVRRKKKGGNKLTDVAGEPEDGTTPTTGPVGTTGRAEAESANGKEQIPLGADGMWRAASSRERVSRADS